jgi:hypothetical protein
MKNRCNKALYETSGCLDFDVIWLDDHVEQLIQPISRTKATTSFITHTNINKSGTLSTTNDMIIHRENATKTQLDTTFVSMYAMMKVIVDFIRFSGYSKVSSRDIDRYLKEIKVGDIVLLDALKQRFMAFDCY